MTDDPVERAKTDRTEAQRQISRLDVEIARMVQQKGVQVAEVAKLTAFIDLYAKYTAPLPLPAVEATTPPPAVSAPAPEKPPASEAAAGTPAKAEATPKKTRRRKGIVHKPKNAPSMPNMIREALMDAQARGIESLDSRGIQGFIASKWWSSVTVARIRPVAWRMFNAGELRKVSDGVYALPAPAGTTGDELRAAGIIPLHAKVVGEP